MQITDAFVIFSSAGVACDGAFMDINLISSAIYILPIYFITRYYMICSLIFFMIDYYWVTLQKFQYIQLFVIVEMMASQKIYNMMICMQT